MKINLDPWMLKSDGINEAMKAYKSHYSLDSLINDVPMIQECMEEAVSIATREELEEWRDSGKSEMSEENQSLESEISQLEAEIEKLKKKIEELEK